VENLDEECLKSGRLQLGEGLYVNVYIYTSHNTVCS